MTRKLALILVLICLSFSGNAQDLKTTFYQNYNHWKYQGEIIHTVFEGSYDQWRYGDLEIKQRFRGQQDEWLIGDEVLLKTRYQKSYNRWEIQGHDLYIEVERSYFGNTSTWNIRGDFLGSFSMTFANDYERWNFDDLSSLPEDVRAALVFLAIFTSVREAK